MKFPRPTKRIGRCLAVISKGRAGCVRACAPVLNSRPTVTIKGKCWKASRLSYSLNVSKIPCTPKNLKRGLVLHTCDHEWCIEPRHLYLGSQQQNAKDKWSRHPTVRADLSRARIGMKFTKQHRLRLSIAHKRQRTSLGKRHTLEAKRKMSVAAKARYRNAA